MADNLNKRKVGEVDNVAETTASLCEGESPDFVKRKIHENTNAMKDIAAEKVIREREHDARFQQALDECSRTRNALCGQHGNSKTMVAGKTASSPGYRRPKQAKLPSDEYEHEVFCERCERMVRAPIGEPPEQRCRTAYYSDHFGGGANECSDSDCDFEDKRHGNRCKRRWETVVCPTCKELVMSLTNDTIT